MSEQAKTVVTTEEKKMCTTKEKIGHAIGVLGHDSAYSLWSSYATPFMTDILQIPAVILGVLLAFGRIFDGVNDIFMGFLADKTKSKFGRFRAWLLRAGPLFCLCMALSFFVPGDNMTVRIIWACIMYVIVDVAFTAVDIPFWSLPAAMTSNTKERGEIIASTTTASNAISGAVGIAMPLLLGVFGGVTEGSAYFKAALTIGIFGAAMYLISFALVREHVTPDPQQKFEFKLALKNIYQNKPLLLLMISYCCATLAMILRGNFNYYYAQYNLGNYEYMSILSMISMVGMIVGALLFPVVSKWIGKKNTMFALTGVYMVTSFVQYIAGYSSLAVIFVCATFTTTCIGAFIVCVNAMMADTIEYGEWKTGQRNEGMITSTRCFTTKLVMAVSGVVVAAVIGLTGYQPLAEVQSTAALSSFHFMYSLAGGFCMIAAIIPMFFYNLTEKKHAEIMAELAARKAQQ